ITQNNKIYSEATRYYKENESGIRRNIALNQQWQTLLKDTLSGKYLDNTQGLRTALAELQTQTKLAGAEVKTLWAQIKKLFTDHFGSISATAMIGTAVNTLRNVYEKVKDIDAAMTELKKVTELTEAQYESFGKTAKSVADTVGGTISDTINAVADFSRLGYNIGDATKLAEAAIVYKNVGDGIEDISTASESIISTMKAFGIESDEAMFIVDKFNEVGNKFAIDSAGVGEALRRSAAALASANNTLDESIALVTAGNNVIQDPDTVGTALKTSSMFLRAAKTEAEEAGIETDGMADSVSKLREELLSLSGVDIMLDSETFKSTYQVYEELADVWDRLSDVTQANILEKLGGKRQANIIASIITNFDEAKRVIETSMGAEGSALEENDKYLESIEGHAQNLERSFEKLSMDFLDEEVVKTVLDVLKSTVDIVDELGNNGIITGLISGSIISKVVSDITKSNGAFTAWKNNLIGIFGSESSVRGTQKSMLYDYADSLRNVYDGLIDLKDLNKIELFGSGSLANANESARAFAATLPELVDYIPDVNDKIKMSKVYIDDWAKSASNASNQSGKWSKIWTGLKGTLISAGITLGITVITSAIQYFVNKAEEAKAAIKEAADEAREETENLSESYLTLQETYNAYRQGTKTKDEYIQATYNLTDALGMEREEVQGLIGDYGELSKEINSKMRDTILSNLADQSSGLALSSEALFNEGKKSVDGGSVYWRMSDRTQYENSKQGKVSLYDFLTDYSKNNADNITLISNPNGSFEVSTLAPTEYASDIIRGNFSYEALNSIKEYYENTLKLRNAIYEYYGKEAENIGFYKQLNLKLNDLKNALSSYTTEVQGYYNGVILLRATDGKFDLNPDNLTEYINGRNELFEEIKASGDYRGLSDVLDTEIGNVLKVYGFSAYEKALPYINQIVGDSISDTEASWLNSLSKEDLAIIPRLDNSLFNGDLETLSKAIEDFKNNPNNQPFDDDSQIMSLSEIAEDLKNKIKVISAAMGEMDDSGSVTTSTYNELLSLGDEYSECIEYQNGKIVVNIQKLKELAAQHYLNAAAAAKLELAQKQMSYGIVNSADDYRKFIEKTTELNKIIAENTVAADEILNVSIDDKTKNDTKNTEFETLLDDLKDKYDRGLYDYEEYLKKRVALIDQYYPDGSEDPEITAQRKKLLNDVDWDALYDTRMSKWENQNGYDPTDIKSIQARNKAAAELAKSMYFGVDSEHQSPTQYKEAISKIADSELEVLKDMYDRGLIMTDEYIGSVNAIRKKYTDENGEFIIPITFVTEAVVDPEDVIKGKLKEWKDKYDYDETDEEDKNNIELRKQYSEYYRNLVTDTYGNKDSSWYNPAKLAEYLKEIDDYDLDIEETRQEQTINYLNDIKSSIEERYNLE
ncbi:MAG: phage tail tape measure protein, partial [Ruminiclostridium sp.]